MTKINWKELGKGFLLLLICLFFIPTVIGILFVYFPVPDYIYTYLANGVNYLFLIFILVSVYKTSLWTDWKDFKKKWKQNIKIAFKYWILSFLFMILCNMIILQIAGNMAVNETENRTFIDAYPILSIFLMIVFGPFIEELLFRKGFKNAFQNPKWFMIVSGLLFGFSHLIAAMDFTSMEAFRNTLPQMLYIIPYGGMGFFMAKAYVETNNIFTSVTMHTLHNAIMISLILLMGLFI